MPLHAHELQAWFAHAPAVPRVLAGVAGLLLLLAGGRVYRLAVLLPGLVLGLGTMARGKSANTSQLFMRWRVGLQFVAILCIMVLLWLRR